MGEQIFTKINASLITGTQYTDNTVTITYEEPVVAEYYLKALDKTNNLSSASDYASVGISMWKKSVDQPYVQNATFPVSYSLDQAFPNPFNPVTNISFELPQDGHVRLRVYDVNGQQVSELVNEFKKAGRYQALFNGTGLSSGIYFYRMEAGNFKAVKRMLLVK